MALTDLTRVSTSGIATGTTLDNAILRKDTSFKGNQVGVTSALFDSSEKELNLKDNVKLTFGDATNGDLRIFHDGSDSRISNGGGITYLLGDVIRFRNHGDSGNILNAALSGVDLYASTAVKLSTNAWGVNVTGILTATAFSGGAGGINAGVVTCTGLDLNGNGDVSGNLVLGGNLTVNGTTTTLDTNLTEGEGEGGGEGEGEGE